MNPNHKKQGESTLCVGSLESQIVDTRRIDYPRQPKEELALNLRNQLETPTNEVDHDKAWASFRETVYRSAQVTLGHPKRKHHDWVRREKLCYC